ncbi:MAG: hypothetical protein H0T44_06095 [Gemmatimonadales bacterium]|nr:hypothetical protein [Gemmatimonadales bacterium]
MTHPSGPHLSPDDIEVWLSGALAPERERHLESCRECLERAHVEREIVEQLSALPAMGPALGFSERVMQSVILPDPFAIRSLEAKRRRLFASPKSLAFAAGLTLLLLCSMTASIVWSLGHQDTLSALGSWLASETGQAAWLALRGIATNFIEQPWYAGARALAASPGRLALASALASLTYLAGVVALRRLLALPTQQVAHASV